MSRMSRNVCVAVRFDPGQTRTVNLVEFGGERTIYGFNQAVMGLLEDES